MKAKKEKDMKMTTFVLSSSCLKGTTIGRGGKDDDD